MDPTKNSPFPSLFGKSPFGALTDHMRQVEQGASLLLEFIAHSQAGDWEAAEALHQQINDCEHAADDLKDRIRLNLPSTLFLPISRADLLVLVEAQDKIVNKIKDISGLMTGRRMQFPDALQAPIRAYLETTHASVAQARKVLEELGELLDSGFGRSVGELIADMVAELGRLENTSDQQQVAIRRQLLPLESELPPLEMMFIYRVIDAIGSVADRAERAGSRLQILATR